MKQFVRRGFALLLAGMLVLLSNTPALAEENTLENPDATGDPDPVIETVQYEELKEEATPAAQADDSLVSIPDAELKSRLLSGGFDKNGDGELSVTEMQDISQLDIRTSIYTKDITNLTGLETATNVETFAINCAQIADFSALRSMPNINTVAINNATINNSSLADSLKSSAKLETLILNMDVNVDASALGMLSQLKTLNLYSSNLATDISGIANLANLQELILDSTGVNDLSPLASCKNLKELSIQNTAITDLTPLAACANLENLNLGWDLNQTSGITDISALASCKNLKELSVTGDTAITAEMIFDALTPDEQTCNLSIGSSNIVMFNNCKISISIEGNLEQNFGAKNMSWASENPDIVEVTNDFKFNAKQAGTAKVTATFGNISKIFNIVVAGAEQPTPTPTPKPTPTPDTDKPNAPSAEFGGATSDDITVSTADAQTISRNALAFIQKNYAEQLAKLGNEYKVVASLNLTTQKANDIEENAKNAFNAIMNGMSIGQYYDINILASVVKDGITVEGLRDIPLPNLDKEITLNLKVPESIRKAGRAYIVLHYHNNKATSLNTQINNYTVSFRTDSFSPYLLAYKDITASGTTDNNASITSPKTGDDVSILIALLTLILSVLTVAIVRKRRNFLME